MLSSQISKILSKNPETKKLFRGVYPADALPSKDELLPSSDHILIINTCAHYEIDKYCHWIFVFIPKKKKSSQRAQPFLEYFCSSGYPTFLANQYIARFLINQNRKVKFMNEAHQSLSSKKCGKFVCVYSYAKAIGFSMNKVTKLFSSKKLNENDAIVETIFSCIFKQQKKNCLKRK